MILLFSLRLRLYQLATRDDVSCVSTGTGAGSGEGRHPQRMEVKSVNPARHHGSLTTLQLYGRLHLNPDEGTTRCA